MTEQDSIFAFVGLGMPAASARGVTCSYKPFVGGKVITMLDGADRDLTRHGSRKFVYSVRGSDLWVPPFVGVWPGEAVRAFLPCDFLEPVAAPQQRPAVPGTLLFIDAEQGMAVPEDDPAAAWRVYSPDAWVTVLDWQVEHDEWGAVATWSVDLREVRHGGA